MSSPDPLADKLTIETPEQTPLEFPLAGIGSRFLALALDTLIQSAALLLLVVASLVVQSGLWEFWRGGWTWAAAVAWLAAFCLYYGYFAFFETVWNGQTPGKRYTRLRVIQQSGRPINVYQAIARNLLRIVDQLPGFYAVGILTALLSRQNRRLGDYVAGTVVVREKEFLEMQLASDSPERTPGVGFNAWRLTLEEFQLLEAFLQRRAHLHGDVRAQMAQQIAERLAQKLGIPVEQRPGAEAFLEALAQEHRAAARYR